MLSGFALYPRWVPLYWVKVEYISCHIQNVPHSKCLKLPCLTVEQHDRQRPVIHIFLPLFIYLFCSYFFSHCQVSVSTERGAEKEDRADALGESKVLG